MSTTRLLSKPSWLAEHALYLQSNAWAKRRLAVLERDKWICQARMDGCTSRATQAHHLSYSHWKAEPIFDLIAVCATCHRKITALDRSASKPKRRDIRRSRRISPKPAAPKTVRK